MQQQYYNRYKDFVVNGKYKTLPFISLSNKTTDFYETYYRNRTRLDELSQKYYEVPYYGWLILIANPIVGPMEFSIPDGSLLRIPYPLDITLQELNDKTKNFNQLYGI